MNMPREVVGSWINAVVAVALALALFCLDRLGPRRLSTTLWWLGFAGVILGLVPSVTFLVSYHLLHRLLKQLIVKLSNLAEPLQEELRTGTPALKQLLRRL